MPGQTNHYGTLFGGVLMAQMDKAANIAATRYCKSDCVTVSVDNIIFENPVKLGETIIANAMLIYVGKTSMPIRVRVESETQKGERKNIISCADFVFVAVDSLGKPKLVPEPILENEQEMSLFNRGKEIKESLKRAC
jgi:acyl-CoA hydrolase